MSTFRETPYSGFNFLVQLGDSSGTEVQAGFAEVSGLGSELTVAEYRNGNEATNYVRKVAGIHKTGDVTLKRGVVGADNIWQWLNQVRNGDTIGAKQDVTIHLLNEDRSETVVSWKLRQALPLKWTGPTLTAKGGGDVAMEELVLSVETIEQE